MSKGLGKLQREILETLEQAKQSIRCYHGKGNWWYDHEIGGVHYYGVNAILPDDLYDLRASMIYLAEKLGGFSHRRFISGSFQASFSRAVRGLITRGLLKRSPLNRGQTRFVRLCVM